MSGRVDSVDSEPQSLGNTFVDKDEQYGQALPSSKYITQVAVGRAVIVVCIAVQPIHIEQHIVHVG